eukprot:tig00000158_g10137.t1
MAARCPGVGKQPRIRSVQNQDASAAFRARGLASRMDRQRGKRGAEDRSCPFLLESVPVGSGNRGAAMLPPLPEFPVAHAEAIGRAALAAVTAVTAWRQLRQLRQLRADPPTDRAQAAQLHPGAARVCSSAFRSLACRRPPPLQRPLQLGRQRRRAALAALLSRHAARSRVPGSARRRPASSALSKEQRRLELEAAGLPP